MVLTVALILKDSLTVRVLRPLPALDEHGPAATRSARPARR